MCPVASEDTVCCNLRTIDAVENCGFGCSYCTIQTFYDDQVVIDSRLAEKLENLELDPDRFYHLGTGQSSDSLMWGNQQGLLEQLSDFAARHPNVLLELKTKSKNVAFFLERTTPPNLVLSWSMNTPTIIRNEEHFTASLPERLSAARRVADCGVRVAFHFHPLVYYENWAQDYGNVAKQVTETFDVDEVLFVSFGSVTFIKPVIRAIRERGRPTKMLQMELVPGPKGKLSYPDSVKAEMFAAAYQAFSPWHSEVFMYLCMEKAELWKSTFGFTYPSNEAFETDFGRKVFEKIENRKNLNAETRESQRREVRLAYTPASSSGKLLEHDRRRKSSAMDSSLKGSKSKELFGVPAADSVLVGFADIEGLDTTQHGLEAADLVRIVASRKNVLDAREVDSEL